MYIDIQARGFKLTEGLRSHAERRLRFAFGPTMGRVTNVLLRLGDQNGPRGGVDKLCSVIVTLPAGAPVVIEQQDADLYVAIDRAAQRAGRAVSRRLTRALAARRAIPVIDADSGDSSAQVA